MFLEIKISLICFMFVVMGEPEHIFAPYQRLINRLPNWLNKPLGSCFYCLTGEAALWIYLFTKPFNPAIFSNWIDFLFFVSLSIFLTKIYSIIWNYE